MVGIINAMMAHNPPDFIFARVPARSVRDNEYLEWTEGWMSEFEKNSKQVLLQIAVYPV